MNPTHRIVALTLVALLLACFVLSTVAQMGTTSEMTMPGRSETPAEAVRRAACGAGAAPTEFEVYETSESFPSDERAGRYATVLFRAKCPPSPENRQGIEFAGWADVRREWFAWHLMEDGLLSQQRSVTFSRPQGTTALLDFTVGTGEGIAGGPFSFARIHVFAPGKVDAVEITTESGKVMRRRTADNTATILLAKGAQAVCEVRALDARDKVLQRYRATAANGLDPYQLNLCARTSK
jgi:hypothetical protein